MNTSFVLTVDMPPTPAIVLQRGAPEGVSVSTGPVIMNRGFDVHVSTNFDIKVHVDLGIVSAQVVAAWLLNKFRQSRMNLNPRINGDQLPPQDTEAVRMIEDAILHGKSAGGGAGKVPTKGVEEHKRTD